MSESLPQYWAYSLASQPQGLTLAAAPAAMREILLSLIWEPKPIADGPLLTSDQQPLISIEQGAFTSPYQLSASPSKPSPGQRQWLKLVLPSSPAITQLTLAASAAWFAYLKISAGQAQIINYRGLYEIAAGSDAPSIKAFAADLAFWPALTLTTASALTPLPENIGLSIDFNQDSVQRALAKLEERANHHNLERSQITASLQQLHTQIKTNEQGTFENHIKLAAVEAELTNNQTHVNQTIQQLQTQLTDQVTALEQQQVAYSKALMDLHQQLLEQAITTLKDLNQAT